MIERICLPLPDDFHVHFRQGPLLEACAARTSASFGRAIAMPNTIPPVVDGPGISGYARRIEAAAGKGFTVLPVFKLLPGMSPETLRECASAGAVAGKYYPSGATTNAQDGIAEPGQVQDLLSVMEELDLVLSIHGEDPGAPVFDRETAFLPVLERILADFPRLKVVLEHLSTAEALEFVVSGPERLAATVTAHHLLFTVEDLLGSSINPHLYCKPILKESRHRKALQSAVFGGGKRLFFGSDSAPHPVTAKECSFGASGVYSAPVALEALAGLFVDAGADEAFASFVAGEGARFYGLPAPGGELVLERRDWQVPAVLDGCVPMLAGKTLEWKVTERRAARQEGI